MITKTRTQRRKLRNCGAVAWQQLLFILTFICQRFNMFLGRSESLKWIRQKFTKRNNNNTTAPIEHTPAKISKTNNEICDNIRDLNEILVVTNSRTTTIATTTKTNPKPNLESSTSEEANHLPAATILRNDSSPTATTTNMAKSKQIAPIAREEDDCDELEETTNNDEWLIDNKAAEHRTHNDKSDKDDDDVNTNRPPVIDDNSSQQHQQSTPEQQPQLQPIGELLVINENVVRRSKSSRVRNYLRKCKDRWLAVGTAGHNNANAEHSMSTANTTTNLKHDNEDVDDSLTTMTDAAAAVIMHESNVSKQERCRPHLVTVVSSNPNSMVATLGGNVDAGAENPDNDGSRHRCRYTNCALGCVEEMEDDDVDADSYEDIDFGLMGCTEAIDTTSINTATTYSKQSDTTTNARILVTDTTGQRQEKSMQLAHRPREGHDNGDNDAVDNDDDPADNHTADVNLKGIDEQQLVVDSTQMESQLAALIDNHLASIYPIFNQTTRAVLIREARDVLLTTYHGCLTTFQQQFLCKFAGIAAILRERHCIGEALIWCQGWPLVTPIGEVILHLGGLDDKHLKPAEIYLCVKADENKSEPKLYAIWRTPPLNCPVKTRTISTTATTSSSPLSTITTVADTPSAGGGDSTLNTVSLDPYDNSLYLSPIALEMLSDDLPQLLQNLLIGVEQSLERLSLNQVSASHHHYNVHAEQKTLAGGGNKDAEQKTNNNNQTIAPSSPKCILRRSELITKNNKLHNNKYMLRRFTNRQDSMNSTSSGNSSASGLSTSSSNSSNASHPPAKGHFNHANNNSSNVCNGHNNSTNNNKQVENTNENPSNDSNTSPALPRFCLGKSFPHIDSDEENAEERRNSLTDDHLESEIIAPNLITDLPEKLLLSGIYLPGTRDLKGNPLVTVDAESVLTAGLNCYEVATLLLYYSTIPESSGHKTATWNNGKTELLTPTSLSSNHSTTTAPATPAPAIAIQSSSSSSSSSQSSTTTVSTSSATTTASTCTSLNDNMPPQQQLLQEQQRQSEQLAQQQQHQQSLVTFTILIAIEKSQHLCVIDLISQSLRLLTRHIAHCHILAVCLDTGLIQSPKIVNSNSDVTATPAAAGSDDEKSPNIKNDKTSTTVDTNGNWHCEKKSDTHTTISYIGIDEVTAHVPATEIPNERLGGFHQHDARKWREFFVHYEPFYQQCAGAAQRLVSALNDIRLADLQGLPTRRQLYAQHRALSRALMDSELHNLRKRSAPTMARLQELARNINYKNTNNNYYNSNNNTNKLNGYCSLKSKGTSIGSYYSSASSGGTLNRNKLMFSTSSSYSFNYQGSQNNKNNNNNNCSNSHNVAGASTATTTSAITKSLQPISSLSQATTTTTSSSTNSNTKSCIYPTSSSINPPTAAATASRLNAITTTTSGGGLNYCVGGGTLNVSSPATTATNGDVAIRLQKVTLLFNEIDRAAKRLEQLTEQRREHLRELTRQRALEDEINEVTSWITNDGSECLQRFINMELDWDTPMKEREQEFEKYYFISMKNLAKGRDLHVAAANMDPLQESALHLRQALDCFAEKLETARERIEGFTRLHQLLNQTTQDENTEHEIERLVDKYGIKGLLEKYRDKGKRKPDTLNLSHNNNHHNPDKITNIITSQMMISSSSTPDPNKSRLLCHRSSSYGTGSYESPNACQCWRDSRNLDYMEDDDEEGRSKIADSGVGECQRCEGNPKLTRICSCQSLNEENENLYKKHDELDDECFEQPSKCYMNIHSPLEANKHLQCFASTFELPKLEELSCLDPKIQKTLLLIMREMIGTERDYVRSLYYVIENYIDELLRDDIPQSLRGQRNVIFGNIEKIFEFHNDHFLAELERYENNPLKVGAAFLQMESKFYLYALYNKNKPKSDALMSEYGTTFFKTKQMELNDKMDLASYLLKPVQRMGKYALLLQQLVKACSNVEGPALQEIAADVEELQKAEEMVKFQLRHGNDLLAMDSLRDCDVNLKEQGRLLRQNEFLVWQGRGGKKTLRHIFLFEELVLFSKSRRFPDHKNLDSYIYKNSIKTSDIGLTAHVGDSPTKFEIWFRKRKPEDTWTLQCMSEDIKNAWTEEISKLLWTQAKRNREIRLAEMSSMGIGSKPCLDIRPSNNQINDRSITISQLGKAPKLRHSFVGLNADQTKTSRRPTSLISESSLSSGTSSSSLSKSSTTSSNSSVHNTSHHYQPGIGLELITESSIMDQNENNKSTNQQHLHHHHQHHQSQMNHSGCHSHGHGTTRNRNNHKRSTTIVSQLSMESGIMSDICMTPDQDNNDLITTWTSNPTDSLVVSPVNHNNNNGGGNKFLLKCHQFTMNKKNEHQQQLQHPKDSKNENYNDPEYQHHQS
ncbi:puratrophin-1-like isoform X2 [Musca autumnalis]|uniref:puratrophin-1-like isoform X2 n=1 Tax=Musca autumnalis TaxID=221902 RepID=UPI003CFA07D1